MYDVRRFQQEILPLVGEPLRSILGHLAPEAVASLEEVRLRLGQPVAAQTGQTSFFVAADGRLVTGGEQAYVVTAEDIQVVMQLVSRASIYALEEELRQGYLTVPGGHRLGLAGEAVLEGGRLHHLKHIAAINIRLARELPGCADAVMPFLIDRRENRVYRTLLVSPPRAGKTTLLRDIVRQLSDGIPELGWGGVNVALVDERSEIAACYRGRAQHDVGRRTDILDGCPKAEGMLLAVRSLSPAVVATDEIGSAADLTAVAETLNAGVAVVATVHAGNLGELQARPLWQEFWSRLACERLVVLNRTLGVGTVGGILDGRGHPLLERPLRLARAG